MERRPALHCLTRSPAHARRMPTAILPTRSQRRRPASVSTSIMNISPKACAVLLKVEACEGFTNSSLSRRQSVGANAGDSLVRGDRLIGKLVHQCCPRLLRKADGHAAHLE